MHTAPQRRLLNELHSKFTPEMNKYIATRMGLGSEHSKTSEHSEGSGNLDGGGTVAQKHRGLMGLGNSPHETRATKPGLPAPSRTRPEGDDAGEPEGLSASTNVFRNDPSGLNDMGTPLVTRGISQQMVGDDANLHPSKGQKPANYEIAEDPGNQKATSFSNRYPGARSF